MSYLSECCGAEPHPSFHFDDEIGICGACKEHAHFEEWEEGNDTDTQAWQEKVNAWREDFLAMHGK